MDISNFPLRTVDNASPQELARARQRIEQNIRTGVIKPNAFDPLVRRKLRWPDPQPN
jgi:hypothetical protein